MFLYRWASVLLIAVALIGCSTGEQVARDQAKDVINPIVADKFPGVPAEPITNCIIDNASLTELVELTAAAGTGNNAKSAEIVGEIATRPETLTCIAKNGLPTLLQGV